MPSDSRKKTAPIWVTATSTNGLPEVSRNMKVLLSRRSPFEVVAEAGLSDLSQVSLSSTGRIYDTLLKKHDHALWSSRRQVLRHQLLLALHFRPSRGATLYYGNRALSARHSARESRERVRYRQLNSLQSLCMLWPGLGTVIQFCFSRL